MPTDTGKPREQNQLASGVTDRTEFSMQLEIQHYYEQCTGLFVTWSSSLQCSVNCPIKNWYLEWRTQLTGIKVHHSNKW